MEILNSNYDELDKRIEEHCASLKERPQKVIIKNSICDNSLIVAVGPAWRVTDKNLIAVEGECWFYNADISQYEADWTLTLLYDDVSDEDFDLEKQICSEQGQPMAVIHNYLRAVGKL